MPDESLSGPKPVVLVVDDEPLVRMYAAELFEDLGYEVLEAEDGVDALARLEARDDVSLLFSDCRMPQMGGSDLAAVVSRRWPDIRIVLVSGYAHPNPTQWPLLDKPFTARDLDAVMADARA
ncbi:MAG TPA: response regulator [Caulobacteraceae bacterium]